MKIIDHFVRKNVPKATFHEDLINTIVLFLGKSHHELKKEVVVKLETMAFGDESVGKTTWLSCLTGSHSHAFYSVDNYSTLFF